MRVLLICGSYPPIKCGVGDYTAILAAELGAVEGLTVGLLTGTGASSSQIRSGVELLPVVRSWSVGQVFAIAAQACEWRPDIVHIQYPCRGYGRGKGPLFLPLILGCQGAAVVQTWHEPLGALRRLRYLPAALTRDSLVVVEPEYETFVSSWYAALLHKKRFFRYIPVGSNIPSAVLSEVQRGDLKKEYCPEGCNLIAYFGFVSPLKGVDALFEIADPERDRLLLICDLDSSDQYQDRLLRLMEGDRWRGRSFVTGYRSADEVAALLAVADIALFPFTEGATSRNASVLAARVQGTFVVATSTRRHGYFERENCYFARPGDLEEMQQALRCYAGKRAAGEIAEWQAIAAAHMELYREILNENVQGG